MKDPRFIARNNLKVNASVRDLTQIRTGGNADFLTTVSTAAEFVKVASGAAANSLTAGVISQGSRTVVSDYGYRGIIIHNQLQYLDLTGHVATVGSGWPVADLVKKLADDGYGGFTDVVTYTGSVGGALLDPSAVPLPLREAVSTVHIWCEGKERDVTLSDLGECRDPFILSVKLTVEEVPPRELQRAMMQATQRRLREHPGGVPSVRVFGNTNATELLKQLDMPGESVGGATVSTKDPNYIINTGKATSHDVYELAQRMKHRVSVKLQHRLSESVKWVGEW